MHTRIFLPAKVLFFLLAITTLWTTQVAMKPAPEDTGNTLTVTFSASGTAQLNWSFAPLMQLNTGIIVDDIIAQRTIAGFSTNQQTATVNSLQSGRLYRFKVQNGDAEIVTYNWVP